MYAKILEKSSIQQKWFQNRKFAGYLRLLKLYHINEIGLKSNLSNNALRWILVYILQELSSKSEEIHKKSCSE